MSDKNDDSGGPSGDSKRKPRGTSASRPDTIFLFPLTRVTFFPGTTKPLNVFEPRYVSMINDAIENGVPIALAYADPSPSAIAPGTSPKTGVMSHVRGIAGAGTVRLLERRPDGTMLILLESLGKVRLDSVVPSDKPYVIVKATWIEENRELARENVFLLNRLAKELGRWLEENVVDPKQRDVFLGQLASPEEKVNYFCSLAVTDPECQQTLLEADTLDERLKSASLFLDSGEVYS